MHGLLTTTKRMHCFALRLRHKFVLWPVGVGKIPPVPFKSGEIMLSRPMKAGLVTSLAD